jgi:hypothetical protein
MTLFLIFGGCPLSSMSVTNTNFYLAFFLPCSGEKVPSISECPIMYDTLFNTYGVLACVLGRSPPYPSLLPDPIPTCWNHHREYPRLICRIFLLQCWRVLRYTEYSRVLTHKERPHFSTVGGKFNLSFLLSLSVCWIMAFRVLRLYVQGICVHYHNTLATGKCLNVGSIRFISVWYVSIWFELIGLLDLAIKPIMALLDAFGRKN